MCISWAQPRCSGKETINKRNHWLPRPSVQTLVTQPGPDASSYKDVEGQPGQLGALLPTSILRPPKTQTLVKFHFQSQESGSGDRREFGSQAKWVRAARSLQPSGLAAGGLQGRPPGHAAPGCWTGPYKELPGLHTISQNRLPAWPLDGLAPGS